MKKTPKDLHITIITPQLPIAYRNGGIGSFTLQFVQLLVEEGYKHIHLIYCGAVDKPEKLWKPTYKALGIKVDSVHTFGKPLDNPNGFTPFVHISEVAHQMMSDDTDLLYVMDYHGNGFIPLRHRRYQSSPAPTVVGLMHGPSQWGREGLQLLPSWQHELELNYQERYVLAHSDFVAAPSQYILDWAKQHHWQLPEEAHQYALGYPWSPQIFEETDLSDAITNDTKPNTFNRLVYFGRIETRKGIHLFIEALEKLAAEDETAELLQQLDEIVLLGQLSAHPFSDDFPAVLQALEHVLNIPVTWHEKMNTFEAQNYLYTHRQDALVVIPSLSETFGLTLVECSLIEGLNVISSNAGGLADVLGEAGANQYFYPTTDALQAKLIEWLAHGPYSAGELASYDWQAANARWIAFHEQVCQYALTHNHQPTNPSGISVVAPHQGPSVDVIMPYYNLGKYISYALKSLAEQTYQNFNLVVIDDGSTDEDSLRVFDDMAQKYADRPRWRFLHKENSGVENTRNLGAMITQAPYIIYVDPDNVFTREMIETFVRSIEISGDDVLFSWQYTFIGEHSPFFGKGRVQIPIPSPHYFIPYGNNPLLSLMGHAYGDNNCIIRRSAFEEVGGYTTDVERSVGQEDKEMFVRMAFKGYKIDVVPSFLYYYRYREDSRHRSSSAYEMERRVLRVYDENLAPYRLDGLASMMLGLHYRMRDTVLHNQLQQIAPSTHRYRNREGMTFATQQEYLVDGVRWQELISALWAKFRKRNSS